MYQINQKNHMKIKKIFLLAAFLTIWGVNSGRSQSLGDLFGGSGLGNTIGNMLEGVFSSSNITVADMAGEWTANGPAVCFQGEGFLKKAGGIAAASAIETKLEPYYEQYGLNNAKLSIEKDGKFTLVCKAIRLNGTITRNDQSEPGVFEFNFTALGMKLASVTTYVQKTSGSMDIMFDATKLKKLLSAIGSFTGIQIVKTVSGILDSYDGLAVGSHYTGTSANSNGSGLNIGNILGGFGLGGKQKGDSTQNNQNSQNKQNNQNQQNKQNQQTNNGTNSQTQQGNDAISTGLDLLRGVLKGQ